MSWTKGERTLIVVTFVVIFIMINIFSNIVIKNTFGVSIFDEKYKDKKKIYEKKGDRSQYPHPFYGLASIDGLSIENPLTDESLFMDITHIRDDTGPKVLIIGGSVAAHLTNNPDVVLNVFADTLKKHYKDRSFSIYNAAFGGGKQPQQYFKLIYLQMLGFNPDLVINLDGFNEIALTLSENYDSGIEPIFPRSFAQTIHAAAANRSCADFNNFLTSSNSKVPVIELIGLYFIKSCHHSITGPTKVTPYWGQGKAIEKEYIDKAVNIWETSSNRISNLLNSSNSLYIHAIQPNQYLENSKPFSPKEKNNFLEYPYYGDPIKKYYALLDVNNLKAANVSDLRYLFSNTKDTVYLDICCHFNKLGMEEISKSIIINNKPVFDSLFSY